MWVFRPLQINLLRIFSVSRLFNLTSGGGVENTSPGVVVFPAFAVHDEVYNGEVHVLPERVADKIVR